MESCSRHTHSGLFECGLKPFSPERRDLPQVENLCYVAECSAQVANLCYVAADRCDDSERGAARAPSGVLARARGLSPPSEMPGGAAAVA